MRLKQLFLLLLISTVSFGQQADIIRKQAEQMGNALLQKDYKTFVTFTYPPIVKQMGGADKMAGSIHKQMEEMQRSATIQSITYGQPSAVISEGQELQCTVPQEMIIKTQQGKIKTVSTLLAFSRDKGAHWYFVDAGDRNIATIRTSLPNASKKLVIPKPVPPQFLKN